MVALVLDLDPNRDKPKLRQRHPGGGFPFAPSPFPSPPGVFSLGLNLSGGENNNGFPGFTEMSYWATRGIKSFRIPLSWVFLQTTEFASLNSGYVSQISGVLAIAASLNVKCLLDVHAFGNGPSGKVGTVSTPISAFVDLWTKFSSVLRADPNFSAVLGYDLMNEWSGMDPNNPGQPSTPAGQAIIISASKSVMTALRNAGDNTKLYLEWDHFSGAWDAVTNNIASLMDLALSDPADNSTVSVHCYYDRDSSGSRFVWLTESLAEGQSPPGLSTNINIIPQRLASVVSLAAAKQCPLHWGEGGWSSDSLPLGGNDDYISWNQAADTAYEYCRENNIECHAWAAGPGFQPGYGYNPTPTSRTNPSDKDFTSIGFQGTQTVIIEKYTGYTGPQPNTYRVDAPFGVIPYAPPGSTIPNYKLRYNGKISSDYRFFPNDTLQDGTQALGTFTPDVVDLNPGNNGLTSFSYTPSDSFASINISFTNNSGLDNPPPVGASSELDFFSTVGSIAPNVYATRRLVKTYVGPAIKLQRASDNTQMNFFFNNRGDFPRQAIQDWASSRSISVVTWYDQSGNNNHQIWTAAQGIKLILLDTDGYPSITWTTAALTNVGTPSIGTPSMTIYGDVNPSNTNFIASQDINLDSYRLQSDFFGVSANTGGFSGSVTFGSTLNVWNELCGTYSSLYGTNNLKSYLNGSAVHSANCSQFVNASGGNGVTIGGFNFGGVFYAGSMRTLIIHYTEYSANEVTALHNLRTTYFGTSLPDSLSSLNPLIAGTGTRNAIPSKSSSPFATVTIFDGNLSSPTDTVTLTVTGTASGVLSGAELSGSNPYTLAADTAANITTKLQALSYLSSGTVGQTNTITILVNSSAGTSVSNSSTVITLIAVSPAETPFATPVGTFTPVNQFGVNISGGEQPYPKTVANGPGGTSFDYAYPFDQEIDYWQSKGFGAIRMPTTNRRLQPFTYGSLDPAGRTDEVPQAYRTFPPGSQTNLLAIKAVLDHALSKNVWVVFDIHDFGFVWDSLNNLSRNVATDSEGLSIYRDYMGRLFTKFKNYPNIIWDIMNEPVGGMTAAQWKTTVDVILADLAAITIAQPVWVEGGGNFSGAHDWVSSGNAAAFASGSFTPPVGLDVTISPHQYLDSDDSGQHSTVVAGKGATVLSSVTSWAVTNGRKLALGEWGWNYSDSQPSGGIPSVEGTALVNSMIAAPSQWTGGTFFTGGSFLFYTNAGYFTAAVPTGMPNGPYGDPPQLPIMQTLV